MAFAPATRRPTSSRAAEPAAAAEPAKSKIEEIGDGVSMLLVLGNTIILALDKHPMSPEIENRLEICNFFFTVAFMLEMVLKLGGLGLKKYLADNFNRFDGTIVLISVVETALEWPPGFFTGPKTDDEVADGGGQSGLSVLRAVRLFRIFKLARQWKAMHKLLEKTLATTYDIWPFAVLLFLFMYIFSLLGMQFFANRLRFDDAGYSLQTGSPRWYASSPQRLNFDSFMWAITTVFVVITAELERRHVRLLARHQLERRAYFMLLIMLGIFR